MTDHPTTKETWNGKYYMVNRRAGCTVQPSSSFRPLYSHFPLSPDTLDPALLRPGRLDRKIEFGLPDLEVRVLFCDNDIRI